MSGVNYPPLHTDWEEKLSSNKNSVIQLRLPESECKSNEIFYLQYVPIIWIYDIGNVLKVLDGRCKYISLVIRNQLVRSSGPKFNILIIQCPNIYNATNS